MNVRQEIKLSNYANVIVRDTETKEVISEQTKKNIILHQGMKKWMYSYQTYEAPRLMLDTFGGYIYVGVGTGTPEKSNTALFSQKLKKQVVSGHYSYNLDSDNDVITMTEDFTILSTELNGMTITEIGLGGSTNLSTKILLDEPIAKDSTIEVFINYTITMTVEAQTSIPTLTMIGSPFRTELSYYTLNGIFAQFMGRLSQTTYIYSRGAVIQLGTEGKPTNIDDFTGDSFYRTNGVYNLVATNYNNTDFKQGSVSWVPQNYVYNENTSIGSITYRFYVNTQACPGTKIKEISLGCGHSGKYDVDRYVIFRMTLPCSGVFTKYDFVNVEQLNESADIITLKRNGYVWDEIITNSESIKVNGLTLTKNIDYTIDYFTGVVSWINKPSSSDTITASWSVPYIPKDDLLEFYFDAALEFSA